MTRTITELLQLSLVVMLCTSSAVFGNEISAPISQNVTGTCESRVLVYGYPCEEYTVNTTDGYILSMQRIPHGISNRNARDGQPVLLLHGVLVDGAIWLLNPPDQSLAFILADKGFDVWIANNRGTKQSRSHQHLSAKDSAYWQWTWDELAAYDLPAFVDLVYSKTGKKTSYIGHSQGTLIALAAFSQGKLLESVKSAVLLSPIAHLNHITTVLGRLAVNAFLGENLYKLGLAEFDPTAPAVKKFIENLCSETGINCLDLLTAITGKNCCLNSSRTNLYLEYELQPTSTLNLVHLSQMVRRGSISMFDYGAVKNLKHYKQLQPSAYNVSNISKTLAMFIGYGGKDALSDPYDVGLLLGDLRSQGGRQMTVLYLADYAHADFVVGVSANQQVYHPLISFLAKH